MRSILRRLVDMQFGRNDMTLGRGNFRVRGDTIEVHPAYEESVLRVEMFGDTVDRITTIDPLTGEHSERVARKSYVFPATHYVAGQRSHESPAMVKIEKELQERLAWFESENGKLLEAQRLRMRTQYDLEMMSEVGYCNGIENYSMHIDGRQLRVSLPSPCSTTSRTTISWSSTKATSQCPSCTDSSPVTEVERTCSIEHGFRLPSCS
jgi:excinuclease ABC subunit B